MGIIVGVAVGDFEGTLVHLGELIPIINGNYCYASSTCTTMTMLQIYFIHVADSDAEFSFQSRRPSWRSLSYSSAKVSSQ